MPPSVRGAPHRSDRPPVRASTGPTPRAQAETAPLERIFSLYMPDSAFSTLNDIAQGFIADRIVDLLHVGGVKSTLANIGEIRALGGRPDGSPWRVGIAGSSEALTAPSRCRTPTASASAVPVPPATSSIPTAASPNVSNKASASLRPKP